jgi:hypothetical protein
LPRGAELYLESLPAEGRLARGRPRVLRAVLRVRGGRGEGRPLRFWRFRARKTRAAARSLATGELPERIEDLVPRFLKEVPLDPYDDRPLRYSKESRILWSIGDDGVDAGGLFSIDPLDGARSNAEPTFQIPF